MKKDIKNSSGKITGTTQIFNDHIIIDNQGKPILQIIDKQIINEVLNKCISEKTLIKLYNEYTLSTSEIASLYDRCYSFVNRLILNNSNIKINRCGRRNRAYGHKVSKQQSIKMSKALQGRQAPHYERTPEIRKQTSESLKKYFKTHPQNPQPHIDNWKSGKYKNTDFKIGIAGYFTSLKNKRTIRFRSLLELYYLIQIENDDNITNYQYEPFYIEMDNGKTYTPDFLINDNIIIELKSKKYTERVKGVKEKVEYKKSQAIKYCEQHGYQYKIIYDEDIGFESKKMKNYITYNPDIVSKYNIIFLNPSRMVNK